MGYWSKFYEIIDKEVKFNIVIFYKRGVVVLLVGKIKRKGILMKW